MQYVAYCRVGTDKQGKSGLEGLNTQQSAVQQYVKHYKVTLSTLTSRLMSDKRVIFRAGNSIKLLPSMVLALCLSTGTIASELDELTKTAEQGDADAQYNLGVRYATGRGVPENDTEAVKWYTLAAEQGNAVAQLSLGYMYYAGDGVPQNYEETVKWITMAAEQGDAGAQTILGYLYNVGDGVPQNLILAYVWFNISSINGNKSAQKDRDLIAEKLSSEDLIKAQDLSHEYYEAIQGPQ